MKKFIVIVFLIPAIALAFFSSDRNRAAFLGSYGHIDSGKKFGLEIGMQKAEVNSLLKEKSFRDITDFFQGVKDFEPQSCHEQIFEIGVGVERWEDKDWRGGIICLAYENNELVFLGYSYNMFSP